MVKFATHRIRLPLATLDRVLAAAARTAGVDMADAV